MQRRRADVAVARAGEQRDDRFNAARQPDRNALALFQPAREKIGGERIGTLDQLLVADAAEAVAHREGIRRAVGVPSGE